MPLGVTVRCLQYKPTWGPHSAEFIGFGNSGAHLSHDDGKCALISAEQRLIGVLVDFHGGKEARVCDIWEIKSFENEAQRVWSHPLARLAPRRRMNVQSERHVERCGCHTHKPSTLTTHQSRPCLRK